MNLLIPSGSQCCILVECNLRIELHQFLPDSGFDGTSKLMTMAAVVFPLSFLNFVYEFSYAK